MLFRCKPLHGSEQYSFVVLLGQPWAMSEGHRSFTGCRPISHQKLLLQGVLERCIRHEREIEPEITLGFCMPGASNEPLFVGLCRSP